jgi:hypothetical protein
MPLSFTVDAHSPALLTTPPNMALDEFHQLDGSSFFG